MHNHWNLTFKFYSNFIRNIKRNNEFKLFVIIGVYKMSVPKKPKDPGKPEGIPAPTNIESDEVTIEVEEGAKAKYGAKPLKNVVVEDILSESVSSESSGQLIAEEEVEDLSDSKSSDEMLVEEVGADSSSDSLSSESMVVEEVNEGTRDIDRKRSENARTIPLAVPIESIEQSPTVAVEEGLTVIPTEHQELEVRVTPPRIAAELERERIKAERVLQEPQVEVVYNPVHDAAKPKTGNALLQQFKLTEIKSVKDQVAKLQGQKPEVEPNVEKDRDKHPKGPS